MLDIENFSLEGGDTPMDVVVALAYIRAFRVDKEPLAAMDRVRP